ncbi:formate hydrogenlyase complex iron-sulfur subunit, partial [Cronobacter sakazakii]
MTAHPPGKTVAQATGDNMFTFIKKALKTGG